MRSKTLLPFALLVTPGIAHADVIEISDDGEARIVGLPASPAGARVVVVAANGPVSPDDPFEQAGRRYGIDAGLLRAVAWTESRGNNDAVSPKGARGVMQLMPATAAGLGVDPRDPTANINGGAAYLAQQLATFHDVPLALAAYNAGPGAVRRYGGIPPYRETRVYVSTIMQRWSGPAGLPPPNGSSTVTGGTPINPAAPQPEPAPLPILLIEVPSI